MGWPPRALRTPWPPQIPLTSPTARVRPAFTASAGASVCSALPTTCALEGVLSSRAQPTPSPRCRASMRWRAIATGATRGWATLHAPSAPPTRGAGPASSTSAPPTRPRRPCPTTSRTACAPLASPGLTEPPAAHAVLERTVQGEETSLLAPPALQASLVRHWEQLFALPAL